MFTIRWYCENHGSGLTAPFPAVMFCRAPTAASWVQWRTLRAMRDKYIRMVMALHSHSMPRGLAFSSSRGRCRSSCCGENSVWAEVSWFLEVTGFKDSDAEKNRWINVTQIKQQHVSSYFIQHNTFIVRTAWNLISLNGALHQSSWGSNKYERLVRSCFSWMIKLAAIWHLFSEYRSPKNTAFVLSAWIIVRGGLPLWSWRCDEQSSPEIWAPGPSSAEVPRNLWRTT